MVCSICCETEKNKFFVICRKGLISNGTQRIRTKIQYGGGAEIWRPCLAFGDGVKKDVDKANALMGWKSSDYVNEGEKGFW